MTPETEALDALLDWGRDRMPELISEHEARREKLREVLKQVEAYWNETAPYGEGFTVEKGLALLLYDLRRYQAAVACVSEKERDQKALLDHKAATGQEVEAVRQRWLACLDVVNAVRQALDAAPSSSGEHGEEKR